MLSALGLFFFLVFSAGAHAATPQAAMDALVDEYISIYLQLNPSFATASGVHDFDGRLEDWSKRGVATRIALLKRYQARFAAVPKASLTVDSQLDVGIRMHTGGMSYEDGIRFFEKEGYLSPANAERETKRGTSDPTYLYYTLGKLQILKLREDYRKMKGDKFSLQEFHDELMKQGGAPIRLVRRALLGTDSPAL